MRKVIFRSDGGIETGWGHIYRSLAIVKMLYRDFDCVFASAAPPAFLSDELDKIQVPLIALNKVLYPSIDSYTAGAEVPFDMEHILSGNETVVLDGYWFGSNYQQAIKEKGCRLVYVDDLHEGVYHADVIVNQSPGIVPSQYQVQPYTSFALGLDYAMLRPSFLQAAAAGKMDKQGNSVFICFGGADPFQLTGKSLKAVSRQPFFDEIFCVTSLPNDEMCNAAAASDKRVRLLHQLTEKEMCAAMLHCKYAVVPSSALLIEAIACGMQPVTCFYTQNQQDFHHAMVAAGIHSAGMVSSDFEEKLTACLQQLQNCDESAAVYRLKSQLGRSKENFLTLFNKFCNEKLSVREGIYKGN